MAYGKGSNKDKLKRTADAGRGIMSPDLCVLRSKCLEALEIMASETFIDDILEPAPSREDLDKQLLAIQSRLTKNGLNSKYAEKCRFIAKTSVAEQMKRRASVLIGKTIHIDAKAKEPHADGRFQWLQFSKDWSDRLSEADIDAMKASFEGLDGRGILNRFKRLRKSNLRLTQLQADALREIVEKVSNRFRRPVWRQDAIIQIHLDKACISGGALMLDAACAGLTRGLGHEFGGESKIHISGHKARGAPIPIDLCIPSKLNQSLADAGAVTSLALELGPETYLVRAVLTQDKRPNEAHGKTMVLAEDFGFVNTSSMVLVRSDSAIIGSHLDFAASKPGKKAVRAFLRSHVSGNDVEVLQQIKISGRAFLDRVKEHASRIDRLRSEIDRGYNRLNRLKHELNRMGGRNLTDHVPVDCVFASANDTDRKKYETMHDRFFRLFDHLQGLRSLRRSIYRTVAGLKKSWFGHVTNIKINLAKAHDALIVREDLTILAIEKDDPAYKGRTFNRMLNNGSKGQYIRRSDQKAAREGLAHVALPSAYSSSTDWRNGHVDKAQRKGEVFKTLDGLRFDADLHAAEMLARWLFLRPKSSGEGALAPNPV